MADFSGYVSALDELNILTFTSFYSAVGNARQIADDVLSFLMGGYRMGIRTAGETLGYSLTVDVAKMEEAIYFRIDGKTFEDRVADHIAADDLIGLQTLVRSEYHRVFNAAEMDGAAEFQNRTGLRVTKTWCTMLDEKVRDTHDYLEAMSVPLNEDFYTWDGDHAPAPGGFERAENNVNCRCVLTFQTNIL